MKKKLLWGLAAATTVATLLWIKKKQEFDRQVESGNIPHLRPDPSEEIDFSFEKVAPQGYACDFDRDFPEDVLNDEDCSSEKQEK